MSSKITLAQGMPMRDCPKLIKEDLSTVGGPILQAWDLSKGLYKIEKTS